MKYCHRCHQGQPYEFHHIPHLMFFCKFNGVLVVEVAYQRPVCSVKNRLEAGLFVIGHNRGIGIVQYVST